VAVLSGYPVAYKALSEYDVGQNTEIKLATQLLEPDYSKDVYKLGSIVKDFSVTDVNGKTYKISELLKENKAVILNFWFIGCDPCRMEFPYLQKAYESYQDDLEVIAINPYDGTDATVSAYAERMGLTFPVASEAKYWQNTMQLRAYPTTVVIDRYGMICLVHVGAVTEEETFAQLFAYVTSDSYVQKVYSSIEEMKP
jgi:thiol-disulfide isomerase/thioredoxin